MNDSRETCMKAFLHGSEPKGIAFMCHDGGNLPEGELHRVNCPVILK
jgi:hypothetical protein